MKNRSNVIKIAGALIAWVIGSGFATGQEILQFFSSFGYLSFAVIALNLIGYTVLGYLLMKTGFENKTDDKFNHFQLFCGQKVGSIYSLLVNVTLLLLIPVLFSGGGAALNEYYHIPKALGSGILAVLILLIYLIGFERMIKIISKIGPVIICFSLAVGCISLFRDIKNYGNIPEYSKFLEPYRAAPNWCLSGLAYLGLSFFPSSTYFTQLGISADSKKEIKYGTIIGSCAVILAVTVISTSILLNGNVTAGLDIPVLYLAKKIAVSVGALFSVVLVLGIFSSSSVMMWSVCSRFSKDKKKNTIIAVGVAVFGYIVSLFPFGKLIGIIYPMIGYVGLPFLGCVLWKNLKKSKD